jgi:hypothetical protein
MQIIILNQQILEISLNLNNLLVLIHGMLLPNLHLSSHRLNSSGDNLPHNNHRIYLVVNNNNNHLVEFSSSNNLLFLTLDSNSSSNNQYLNSLQKEFGEHSLSNNNSNLLHNNKICLVWVLHNNRLKLKVLGVDLDNNLLNNNNNSNNSNLLRINGTNKILQKYHHQLNLEQL